MRGRVGGVPVPLVFLFSSVLSLHYAGQAVLRGFLGLWPCFPKPKVELCLTGGLMKPVCTHEIFQLQ